MGKRGFTLIELLSVIALLGIIVVIAVPSISGIVSLINQNMLDKKLDLIEESAVMFAEDIKGSIMASDTYYNGYKCKTITVSELVEKEYLSKDKDDCTKNSCVIDPRNENNYLDSLEVIIYYRNKRLYAKVDDDNTLECS